ncbi:MAG: hypothetical protein FJY98_01435 [Candidatus Liptonbacteria bacterium]|nr:hypothetical protein [Candidatus Liptonbacteria bacterium]
MAIIIEEEREGGTSLITIVIWIVILGVVGAAAYYLFFKNPDFISFSTPPSFQNTEALAKIDLNPEKVVRSPEFQALKQYTSLPQPSKLGRKNPFLGF